MLTPDQQRALHGVNGAHAQSTIERELREAERKASMAAEAQAASLSMSGGGPAVSRASGVAGAAGAAATTTIAAAGMVRRRTSSVSMSAGAMAALSADFDEKLASIDDTADASSEPPLPPVHAVETLPHSPAAATAAPAPAAAPARPPLLARTVSSFSPSSSPSLWLKHASTLRRPSPAAGASRDDDATTAVAKLIRTRSVPNRGNDSGDGDGVDSSDASAAASMSALRQQRSSSLGVVGASSHQRLPSTAEAADEAADDSTGRMVILGSTPPVSVVMASLPLGTSAVAPAAPAAAAAGPGDAPAPVRPRPPPPPSRRSLVANAGSAAAAQMAAATAAASAAPSASDAAEALPSPPAPSRAPPPLPAAETDP